MKTQNISFSLYIFIENFPIKKGLADFLDISWIIQVSDKKVTWQLSVSHKQKFSYKKQFICLHAVETEVYIYIYIYICINNSDNTNRNISFLSLSFWLFTTSFNLRWSSREKFLRKILRVDMLKEKGQKKWTGDIANWFIELKSFSCN